MYHNFKEIWDGFSKNLFAAIGYSSPGLLMLVLIIVALYIVPYAFLFGSLLVGSLDVAMFWIPLFQIIIALLCRVIIAGVFRQSIPISFLHVLSQMVLVGIAINSFVTIKFGRGSSWKGRNYNFSR